MSNLFETETKVRICSTIKAAIIRNPKADAKKLAAILKRDGLDLKLSTIQTVRTDFIDSVRVLTVHGWKAPAPVAAPVAEQAKAS